MLQLLPDVPSWLACAALLLTDLRPLARWLCHLGRALLLIVLFKGTGQPSARNLLKLAAYTTHESPARPPRRGGAPR